MTTTQPLHSTRAIAVYVDSTSGWFIAQCHAPSGWRRVTSAVAVSVPAGCPSAAAVTVNRVEVSATFADAECRVGDRRARGSQGRRDRCNLQLARNRVRSDARRHLVAAESVPQRQLPMGLLRRLAKSDGQLVFDGDLRQPREDARLSKAAKGDRPVTTVARGGWSSRSALLSESGEER
jgi:hypothetical protein